MAQSAKLPSDDVVLVLTHFEAEALLSAAREGKHSLDHDGRTRNALQRGIDSLSAVTRRQRENSVFGQG